MPLDLQQYPRSKKHEAVSRQIQLQYLREPHQHTVQQTTQAPPTASGLLWRNNKFNNSRPESRQTVLLCMLCKSLHDSMPRSIVDGIELQYRWHHQLRTRYFEQPWVLGRSKPSTCPFLRSFDFGQVFCTQSRVVVHM